MYKLISSMGMVIMERIMADNIMFFICFNND